MRRSAQDWVLLFSLVLMWGTAFLFTRAAVAGFSPLWIVAGRVGSAGLLLVAVVWLSGMRLPTDLGLWRRMAVLALFGNALPFFLIAWGQEEVDSGLAGVLMAIMPLATLLLAHFFVAGEPLTSRRLSGFLLGFAGIVVLTGPEALIELAEGGSSFPRQVAILGGAVCYAVNAILARRLPPTNSFVVSAGVMLSATVFMLPAALLLDPHGWGEVTVEAATSLAWLGVVSTAVATLVYFRLIASAGATFVALINFQIPVVALLAGAVVFGEPVHGTVLVALALLLGGIALAESGREGAG